MSDVSFCVLDISVLLFTPKALFDFPDKEVVLPVCLLDELDYIKMDHGEKGRSAKIITLMLDECRKLGSLSEGVCLSNGGKLRIDLTEPKTASLPFSLDYKNISNKILAFAKILHQEGKKVIFVSQDENIRTKADILNIPTTCYQGNRLNDSILYSGMHHYEVDKQKLRRLANQSSISKKEVFSEQQQMEEINPNEGLLLSSSEVPDEKVLATFNFDKDQFENVSKEQGCWGIRARNPEQQLAMALLQNPDISIVTLSGKSGTGKTLLALAVGLQQVLVNNVYSCMLASRPIFPMGRDLGYLPGDTQEKLAPWMQPIFDNLELLMNNPEVKRSSKRDSYHELMNRGMLIVEPLTYIRGRTIPNQYMIVDEAQNLTPHEMKTIVTRVGRGTKIVLTGDPNQIDNQNVNLSSNGLSMLVESFKKSTISGHVRFTNCERSPLAELAATLL